MNSSDRAAEPVPSLSSTRSAAHSWSAALRLALLDLRDPSPRLLSQQQVRTLNRCGRLLSDCYGDGEMFYRSSDDQRALVWSVRGPAPEILLSDRRCWNRRGDIRPRRVIRSIRRRVRLDRRIRSLEQRSLIEDTLDALNGQLTYVR